MKRTPIKRSGFKRKSTWKRLNPISKNPRRKEKRFIPPINREKLEERSGGWCEFYLRADKTPTLREDPLAIRRCFKRADDPHHIKKKSRGGGNEVENLIHGCRECHTWTEKNDREAVKRGTSKLAERSI